MIASREWLPRQIVFVAQLPGDGGKDWGYTSDRSKAIPLSTYWRRRFAADCRRVGTLAHFAGV